MTSHVFCLDASACALLSEDYPGTTRLHFQRELVACHSGAAARRHAGDVALVASASGRAAVALHPSSEPDALRAALDGLEPEGEANLEAALKLALLVSRRFPAGATHVTAFVASPGAADSLAGGHLATTVELRQRYVDAGVSLDVAVLCSRQELGDAAAAALEALTCSGGSGSSSSEEGGEEEAASSDRNTSGSEEAEEREEQESGSAEGVAAAASPSRSSGASRLLWLTPVDPAEESWQQLEPALEQLERRRASAGATPSSGGSSSSPTCTGDSGGASALPRQISRAPRQYDALRHPRTSLLSTRSGVQQPALCRGESLNRLGHLSSDGMMRHWLPTYSSLAQQAGKSAAAAAAGGSAGPAQMVFVEVQPIPRWRTLLKVSAGRMLLEPSSGGSGSGGCSPTAGYAAASSQLLRSLEALSVLDDEAAQSGSDSDGATVAAGAPPRPVRYRPDGTRGTLRLLQSLKDTHLLKLVWSPSQRESSPAAASGAGGQQQAQQQEQQLDMFGTAGSSRGSGAASARHADLLGYMPASAVAASAARGPILQEGCELWESAATFEWELPLPTPERADVAAGTAGAAVGAAAATAAAAAVAAVDGDKPGPGSASSGSASEAQQAAAEALPAAVAARQLPNGAQLVLVTPAPTRHGGSSARVGRRQRSSAAAPAAAAFWLQQRLQADSLAPPTYCTATVASSSQEPAAKEQQQPEETEQKEEAEEEVRHWEEVEGDAARLAAVLLGHLRAPLTVDLRRLRKDVKSGAVQVTPITVGPMPAHLVRDLIGTRSRLMSGMGVENHDSWGADAGSACSSSGGSSSSSSAGKAAASTSAGGSSAGSSSKGRGMTPEAAAAVMQRSKSAVLSLLRERLNRPAGGKGGSAGGSAIQVQEQQPAVAGAVGVSDAAAPATGPAESASEAAEEPAGAIPCTPQQPPPASGVACSYSSSTGGTPFGTPMTILPLCRPSGAATGTDVAAAAAEAAVAGGEELRGLPGQDEAQLLAPKQVDGGSSVLVGAAGHGAEGGDGDLFQLE